MTDLVNNIELGENIMSKTSKLSSFISNMTNSNETDKEKENEIKNGTSLQAKISRIFNIKKSFCKFIIVLLIGVGILFSSLITLPFIVIAPWKFISTFSLGTFVCILSFIFYLGIYDFLTLLFNKSRKYFTFLYLFSLVLGIILAVENFFFVWYLICSIIQFVITVVYILTFIPGGRKGINMMYNKAKSPIDKIINKNKK